MLLFFLYFAEYVYPKNFPFSEYVRSFSRAFAQFLLVVPSRTPLLPFLEHLTGWDLMRVGGCRIKNIRAIEGNGYLEVGYFSYKGRIFRHVRGWKDGKIIDFTCPECIPVKTKFYRVTDYQLYYNGRKIEMPIINPFKDPERSNLYYIYWALKSDQLILDFGFLWKKSLSFRVEVFLLFILASSAVISIPFLVKYGLLPRIRK